MTSTINSKNIKGSKKTIFACARFGNVIGTRGSIVPYLAMQIKNNQNLKKILNQFSLILFFQNHTFNNKKK